MLQALRRTRTAMQDVRRFLARAEELAVERGRHVASVEDLVRAALDGETDDSANRALAAVHMAPSRLVRAMEEVPADALRRLELDDLDVPVRATRRPALPALDGLAEAVWQDVAQRRPRGRRDFRTADVIVVVTELQEGTVARALTSLHVDRHELHDAATTAATA